MLFSLLFYSLFPCESQFDEQQNNILFLVFRRYLSTLCIIDVRKYIIPEKKTQPIGVHNIMKREHPFMLHTQ